MFDPVEKDLAEYERKLTSEDIYLTWAEQESDYLAVEWFNRLYDEGAVPEAGLIISDIAHIHKDDVIEFLANKAFEWIEANPEAYE